MELCCWLLRCLGFELSKANPNNLPLLIKSDISGPQWHAVHWVEGERKRWSISVLWSWGPVLYKHSRSKSGNFPFAFSRMACTSKDQGHSEAYCIGVGKPPQFKDHDNSFLKIYLQGSSVEAMLIHEEHNGNFWTKVWIGTAQHSPSRGFGSIDEWHKLGGSRLQGSIL